MANCDTHVGIIRSVVLSWSRDGKRLLMAGSYEKPKVMLKCASGFIMTKTQMRTVEGDIWWQFAKSPGVSGGLPGTAQIFKDHGYNVVPWDDGQVASDGSAIFAEGA